MRSVPKILPWIFSYVALLFSNLEVLAYGVNAIKKSKICKGYRWIACESSKFLHVFIDL
jgi:hypothetical protein